MGVQQKLLMLGMIAHPLHHLSASGPTLWAAVLDSRQGAPQWTTPHTSATPALGGSTRSPDPSNHGHHHPLCEIKYNSKRSIGHNLTYYIISSNMRYHYMYLRKCISSIIITYSATTKESTFFWGTHFLHVLWHIFRKSDMIYWVQVLYLTMSGSHQRPFSSDWARTHAGLSDTVDCTSLDHLVPHPLPSD